MRYLLTPRQAQGTGPGGRRGSRKKKRASSRWTSGRTPGRWNSPTLPSAAGRSTLSPTRAGLRQPNIWQKLTKPTWSAGNSIPLCWTVNPGRRRHRRKKPPANPDDCEGPMIYRLKKSSKAIPFRCRSWYFPSWASRRNITSAWRCMCWQRVSQTRTSCVRT